MRPGKRGAKDPEYQKSYRWNQNSCWLDSSLTVLFAAASRDYYDSMDPMFSELPASHPLLSLRQMIYTRLETVDLAGYEPGGSNLLAQQRDGFRKVLRDVPRSTVTLTNFNTMFVSKSFFERRLQPTDQRALLPRVGSILSLTRTSYVTYQSSRNTGLRLNAPSPTSE